MSRSSHYFLDRWKACDEGATPVQCRTEETAQYESHLAFLVGLARQITSKGPSETIEDLNTRARIATDRYVRRN